MYAVSSEYKKAIAKRFVTDRISGTITLGNGTSLTISDKTLVKNSLKISHELCGDYRIGTFNLGCLQITIFDDNALLRDFTNARICPVYEIETEAGWESVPMGIYLADGNSARRKRNTVSLTAYDLGILFDKVIPDDQRTQFVTAAELIEDACANCGVTLGGVASGLPNASVRVWAKNKQIQTYRDLIAWCAALLCGYAVIDRTGALQILPAKYSVSGSDSSMILTDKILTAAERDSIYVTDTRAYIKTLHAYCRGALKTYVSNTVQSDEQAAAATYTLAENPIVHENLGDAARDQINTDWLQYIDGFKQRGITAEIFGDPALDVGDVLRCSGGDIDQRRSVVGLVTKQEWRYRNLHTVICAAPQLSGKTEEHSAAVVESQTEKRLNALYAPSLTAGKGISVAGNTISLKPAKKGDSDHFDNLLGGVWVPYYNSGLNLEYDGLLSLSIASRGKKGGIEIGDGLIINSWSGYCSLNLGKGMRFNSYNDYDPGSFNVSYGKSVSPDLGDGLKFDPDTDQTSDNYGKIHLNLGKGLEFGEREYEKYEKEEYPGVEFTDYTRYTSEVQLKLGEGLKFGENGELIATAAGGKEYKAGENISISEDGTISADVKEYTAGENITISSDGKISATGGGAELAPGGGIAIETDEETGKQTISAAVGEGAEIRDGKICTVPNIQNAVLITEADAQYLLHDFTQVEYIAGNQIGYAGGQNQIVNQGLICYKEGGIAPNGATVVVKSNTTNELDIPDVPTYTEMNFNPAVKVGTNEEFVKIELRPFSFSTTYYILKIVGTKEDGTEMQIGNSGGYQNYDDYSPGLAFVWKTITPPGESDFGSATATLFLKHKASATAYRFVSAGTNFTINFASLAEYQAAVGLTYEPLTLTEVTDNPTIVSGKDSGEGVT